MESDREFAVSLISSKNEIGTNYPSTHFVSSRPVLYVSHINSCIMQLTYNDFHDDIKEYSLAEAAFIINIPYSCFIV
jgi:hypothetical protein